MKTMMIRVAALAAVVALIVAACSGDDASDDSGADNTFAASSEELDAPTEAVSGEDFEDASAQAPGEGGADEPAVQQIQNQDRDIIFTADVSIGVTDVAAAGAEAIRIVESLGGFVFGQDSVATPVASNVLIFRISPENFQRALTELGGIGDVRSQTVSADDVTGVVVDLESRITTAQASVERLRTFLENATTVEQVAQLERELLDRETELERMRGQLRSLRDQVSLATITVRISEALSNPGLSLGLSAYPGHDDAGASCPGDGGLAVEEGALATLCYQITNTGDTPLTSIELTDTVLGIELGDLIIVFGDPTQILEPGQVIDLAYEVEVSRDLRTQTRVSAIPVNADGDPVTARQVAQTGSIFVGATDPGGLPGFGDGLSAGWDLLKNIAGLAVLAFGAILPFIWLIPVVWLAVRWRRRRQRATVEQLQDSPPDPASALAATSMETTPADVPPAE